MAADFHRILACVGVGCTENAHQHLVDDASLGIGDVAKGDGVGRLFGQRLVGLSGRCEYPVGDGYGLIA